MGLTYRIRIDGQWYFMDTSASRDEQVTRFFSDLKPGTAIRGGTYRKRGHKCMSWIVSSEGSVAPSNVLLFGLFCTAAFIVGLVSFKLVSLLLDRQFPDGILGSLLTLGSVPLLVILMPTAVLGLLLAPFGILDAFNPRKLLAMLDYRREMTRRAQGVQS